MADLFWTFLGISILVIVTPGPDTVVTIRNALLGGRRGGIFTALGVAAGQALWVLATSVGIVAVIVASEPIFAVIKFAGAAYLVFLGVHALRSALSPSASVVVEMEKGARRTLAPRAAFLQGVASDLGNPKMAIFFTSLLPQFAGSGDGTFVRLMSLA